MIKLSTISLVLTLVFAGCQQQTTTGLDTQSDRASELSVEVVSSEPLQPSEIELGQIIQSEIDSNAIAAGDSSQGGVRSQVQNKQVAVSQAKVEQIISDLNAVETSQGLKIDLPESILFDFDKYDLRSEAQPTLAKVAELITFYKDAAVEINGHTDNKGSDVYNQQLSENRAEAVKQALVDRLGIDGDRLNATGFGETQPIAENTKSDGKDNPEGRQKNRRVEVIVRNN